MRTPKFKSIVAMANVKLSIKASAVILASSTLLSALLGIFRDRLLNSYYLDTYPTGIDAYTAAFTIPDFMFFILTSG
ncbi:virulence factor MviN, partial [Candidatus Saccharibacteria bacterium]|nr:virulence factor MviN [Candidatus Saccharibacteria bacterium]